MKNVHPVYGAGIQTQPLKHESPPMATRPGLPPFLSKVGPIFLHRSKSWVGHLRVFGSGDWKFACPLPRVHIDYRTKLEGFEATYLQTAAATFWATFGNIWATFYFNIWSHFDRPPSALLSLCAILILTSGKFCNIIGLMRLEQLLMLLPLTLP